MTGPQQELLRDVPTCSDSPTLTAFMYLIWTLLTQHAQAFAMSSLIVSHFLHEE